MKHEDFDNYLKIQQDIENRAHERMHAYFQKTHNRYTNGWRFSQISDNGLRQALAYTYGDGNDLFYLPIDCLFDDDIELLRSIH